MRALIREYLRIEKAILYVIIAEFFLQIINSSFLSMLPLYMKEEGYTDGEIADFTSYRFVGVVFLALFIGLYIRGRKVKHLFFISCICVPLFALLILYSIHLHNSSINYFAQILWGASFTFIQIPVVPFILRNCKQEHHTGAIALSYATWSMAGIFSSIVFAFFGSMNPELFSARNLLYAVSVSGFISLYFLFKMKITEHVPVITKKRSNISDFDWGTISWVLIPTLIIAIGAGFTIPFISLFFESVHGFSFSGFASVNLIASVLIVMGAILVPKIKQKIGYQIAIPTTQSFAIIALVLMATTQFYNQLAISAWIAVGCFLLRQPLMNLAGPMTTEVTMGYVGKRNQEMVSALTASIWSGSWYFSAIMFRELRNKHVDYANIFMITAVLYTVGVVWYYFLVKEYNRKIKSEI